jgi:2-iminobutanoate/2-iminopropanoate deaminase
MKQVIHTPKAPAAIGPYSQGIKVAGSSFVFCSGQIPLDPESMKIVGETAAEQCRQAMTNAGHVLAAAGVGFEDVVKATIFLIDFKDFAEVNEVYSSFFTDKPPARSTVEAARLPLDVRIEIELIAVEK